MLAMVSETRVVTSQTPNQFACGARLIQRFSVNVTPQRPSLTETSWMLNSESVLSSSTA